MPNHERKLYHPDDSDNDPRRDIRAAGMDGRWSMGSEVEIWRTGSLLDVILFLSSLLWISARYKWRRHGFYHLRISVNGRWSFPVRRICRKVTLSGTDRLWDLWVRTIAYVERLIDCFLSYYGTGLCSPGGLHLKRGIM
jgi:hypothetical protein